MTKDFMVPTLYKSVALISIWIKFCSFFTHKIGVLHGEEVKQEHPAVTESITGSGPPSAARQSIWLLMGGGSSFLRPPEHRLCTGGNPSSCACEAQTLVGTSFKTHPLRSTLKGGGSPLGKGGSLRCGLMAGKWEHLIVPPAFWILTPFQYFLL